MNKSNQKYILLVFPSLLRRISIAGEYFTAAGKVFESTFDCPCFIPCGLLGETIASKLTLYWIFLGHFLESLLCVINQTFIATFFCLLS